jgi:hypothetical protein
MLWSYFNDSLLLWLQTINSLVMQQAHLVVLGSMRALGTTNAP